MDKTAKTIRAYNKNFNAFAEKFMEFPAYTERINEFIALLCPGAKVLDLGCGPGNVSRQLALSGKGFTITGVDLSEEMVKLAQKNVPEAKFYCQDIREIDFPEASFDAILLSFCIVHLIDAEMIALMQKVSCYLKRNGKLYLSFMEGKQAGFERTSFSAEEIYFNYYVADKIETVLKDNGLTPTRVSKQDYPEADGTVTTDVFIFAEKC